MDDHETIENEKGNFITGSEYERLMRDFLNMGGDPKSCPFDTDDKKYEGPRIEDGEIIPK